MIVAIKLEQEYQKTQAHLDGKSHKGSPHSQDPADHLWVQGWSLGTVQQRDFNFLHSTDGTEPDVSLDPTAARHKAMSSVQLLADH